MIGRTFFNKVAFNFVALAKAYQMNSSQSLDWLFCAVNPLVSEGFTKIEFSICPFGAAINAQKSSLILCFPLEQRDMSFRERVFITL